MTTAPTWIEQARQKIASTQKKDDQAIAEAFAQQAYTAVGNRDRKIMKDPYLLGFEIVDKNEDNNRLVGVFAFRVSGEILMVPVFYLNGQIKGQDLIYRKPVNRFYPNTEKWVNYFVGRGQDETGRPVSRRSNADARIHMGIDRMSRMPGGYKSAGEAAEDPRYGKELDSWDPEDGEYEDNKWVRPLDPDVEWLNAAPAQRKKIKEREAKNKKAAVKLADPAVLELLAKKLGINPQTIGLAQQGYELPVDAFTPEFDLNNRGSIPADKEHLVGSGNAAADNKAALLRSLAEATGNYSAGQDAESLAKFKTLKDVDNFYYGGQPVDKEKQAKGLSNFIKAEWKEACDRSGFRPEHLDQFMFADFLVDHGLQKAAAQLASRVPWFADTIELGGLLDKPLTKRASAPKRSLEYHVDPPAGATEEQVAAHYVRGYSFIDKRAAESLATAVKALADSPFEGSWSTLRKPGLNRVAGKDGTSRKVLWAPTTSDKTSEPSYDGEGRRHKSNPEHRLVFLDGPDKGCVITYRNGCAETELPLFTDDAAVEKEAGWFGDVGDAVKTIATHPPEWEMRMQNNTLNHGVTALKSRLDKSLTELGDAQNGLQDIGISAEDKAVPPIDIKASMGQPDAQQFFANAEKKAAEEVPGDSTPKKGKTYVVWLPGLGKLFGEPFRVDSIESTGDVTKINFEKGKAYSEINCRVILRKDIETTTEKDLKGAMEGNMPRVIGGDAVWIPIEAQLEYESGKPETAANVLYANFQPPASFQPVTLSTIDEALSNSKQANITIERNTRSGLFTLRGPDGKIRKEDLPARHLAIKLARDLRLPGDEATEIVELARTQEKTSFILLPPGYQVKYAGAFYDRDIDPEMDFQDYDWDEDMDLPVENSGQFQDYAEARRERYTRPEQHYLDAHDPGQGRNQRSRDIDHIPDDVILRMVNPMQEMAQMGQQLGLETLMDHGAVGSMVKVFDVKPYMQEYLSKLENSLDHLGRLLFMLYWKPKDFGELFGQDDIPQIENKLTGVFSSYGDLVLELLQSSGEKS